MEDLRLKTEVEGLWIEDRQSKFEDSIMQHSHLIHMFLSVLCRDAILRTLYYLQLFPGLNYPPTS